MNQNRNYLSTLVTSSACSLRDFDCIARVMIALGPIYAIDRLYSVSFISHSGMKALKPSKDICPAKDIFNYGRCKLCIL